MGKEEDPQGMVAACPEHVFEITKLMSFVLKNIQAPFLLSSEPKFEKIERQEGRKEEENGKVEERTEKEKE